MTEKRLNLEMVQKEQEKQEYKRMEVKVGSITAIVKVAQEIYPQDKITILQRSVDLAMEGLPEEVALTLAILETVTNIDFPDTLIGELTLIEYLKDENYLDRIFNMVPQKELEKMLEFINNSAKGIESLSKQGHLKEDSKFMKMIKKEEENAKKNIEKEE